MQDKVSMIFLEDKVLLSKKQYNHWKEIQDEFYDMYKTSISGLTLCDLVYYFTGDYGENDVKWPFSKCQLKDFFESDAVEVIATE